MNNFFFCNLFLVLSYNIIVIVMNIKNKLNRYLNELEYKIVFINNSVNINNYIDVLIDRIEYKNETTKRKMEDIRKCAKDYLDRK